MEICFEVKNMKFPTGEATVKFVIPTQLS